MKYDLCIISCLLIYITNVMAYTRMHAWQRSQLVYGRLSTLLSKGHIYNIYPLVTVDE